MRWKTKDAHTEIIRKFEFFSSRADTSEQMQAERREKTTRRGWKTSHKTHQRQKLKFNPCNTPGKQSGNGGPQTLLWSVQSSNNEINSRAKERWRVTQMTGEDPGDTWL